MPEGSVRPKIDRVTWRFLSALLRFHDSLPISGVRRRPYSTGWPALESHYNEAHSTTRPLTGGFHDIAR